MTRTINVREVEQRYKDEYFIIYQLNNKNYVVNGTADEVLKDLIKSAKELKDTNDE